MDQRSIDEANQQEFDSLNDQIIDLTEEVRQLTNEVADLKSYIDGIKKSAKELQDYLAP